MADKTGATYDGMLKTERGKVLPFRLEDSARQAGSPSLFPATPITTAELNSIPPRARVYGHFLFRKFVSALGAPGGAGKTAYAFVIAAAVASGIDLLQEAVHDAGNVWIYNLEDPRTELLRRIKAVMLGHRIGWNDIGGRIFLDSGRDRSLIIAAMTEHGLLASPIIPDLVAELQARSVRLLIVDPFVRSHRVVENDNDQIDFVASQWAQVADQADCSVLLVCHFKKGGVPGEAAAFRGATALIDASRAAVTLATMSEDEAKDMTIPIKDRWRYARVDNAKLNLAPPPNNAVWLELTGVDLDNAAGSMPSDNVQTVQRWKPASVFRDLTPADCNAVLDVLADAPESGLYAPTRHGDTKRWAGGVIVDKFGCTEEQAAKVISAWIKTGLLIVKNYHDEAQRKDRKGVQVVDILRPT